MNSKQWAVFFVALLSFDYATAFFFGKYGGVRKSYAEDNDGYYGWSDRCRCNKALTSRLDGVLENTKRSMGRYKSGCPLKDTNLEEYEFTNGQLKGFHKFQREGPYRCSVSRNYVRIIYKIGFPDLVICYTVSLVEDILGGLFGGLASLIGRIFGRLTNFLFRIVIPDLFCTVVLIQKFGGRGGFRLEGLYLNEIDDISFQDKRFSKHHNSFRNYFRPICDHVLRQNMKENFEGVFIKHLTKVSAEKDMFYYESSSRKTYGDDYERSDESESGGSSSYRYESRDTDYSYDN